MISLSGLYNFCTTSLLLFWVVSKWRFANSRHEWENFRKYPRVFEDTISGNSRWPYRLPI